VVRSIVFRVEEGEYVMVLAAGPEQISWRALRSALSRSRLTLANPEEVLQATGYERGAVSPFGLPSPMPILVDENVLAEEEISLGSGLPGITIIMRSTDLLDALGDVKIGQFVKP
jgi:prolyl-tRNA editing enzyme YbaK/EbsC (Cys-tRNA(Pro) deacylase)